MVKNEDEEMFVSLTSSGRSAETLGVTTLLGLYKVAGTHNQVCDNFCQAQAQNNHDKVKAHSNR